MNDDKFLDYVNEALETVALDKVTRIDLALCRLAERGIAPPKFDVRNPSCCAVVDAVDTNDSADMSIFDIGNRMARVKDFMVEMIQEKAERIIRHGIDLTNPTKADADDYIRRSKAVYSKILASPNNAIAILKRSSILALCIMDDGLDKMANGKSSK